MDDAKKQRRIYVSFPTNDKDLGIVYAFLEEHVSNTKLISQTIEPRFLFSALLQSGANRKELVNAAIASLNSSRASMIDVFNQLAEANIEIRPEVWRNLSIDFTLLNSLIVQNPTTTSTIRDISVTAAKSDDSNETGFFMGQERDDIDDAIFR